MARQYLSLWLNESFLSSLKQCLLKIPLRIGPLVVSLLDCLVPIISFNNISSLFSETLFEAWTLSTGNFARGIHFLVLELL